MLRRSKHSIMENGKSINLYSNGPIVTSVNNMRMFSSNIKRALCVKTKDPPGFYV